VLGLILSAVLCAANVYLGLMAGMTVSASIPAAVISMGILRALSRRTNVLENNMVQTMASAGESLAAGVIFTVPALVMAGLWTEFRFLPTLFIGILGGGLGVLFMIPLRRTLIVEDRDLAYPEGVACAEILRTGERGGSGVLRIFGAAGAGAVFALLKEFKVLAGTVAGAWRAGTTVFAAGLKTSPALLSVGYIVGPNIAALVCLGGVIAWGMAIPVYMALNPDILAGAGSASPLDIAFGVWDTRIRYMGAGAMVMGGLWSIYRMRRGMLAGLREVTRLVGAKSGGERRSRAEEDLPVRFILSGMAALIWGVFVLYWHFTGSPMTGGIATLVMVVAGFLFVAVSSYIVGLVGSSNNPVSGMTMFTLLVASLLLLAFGATGAEGMIGALVVAGVVCCAACSAGDMSQDLKTGFIVGATPRKQQTGQLLGVLVAAFVTTPVLILLERTKGIGSAELPAPQADMFRRLTEALFERCVPWAMLGAGAGVATLLIVLDEIARRRRWSFRLHVMPVAVGIYLPVFMGVPILLGGIIRAARARSSGAGRPDGGVLVASGLIAGEAVTGIAMAALVLLGVSVGERTPSGLLGVLAFGAVGALLWRSAGRPADAGPPLRQGED
jgi:putative OPT family oligopeptide transporter